MKSSEQQSSQLHKTKSICASSNNKVVSNKSVVNLAVPNSEETDKKFVGRPNSLTKEKKSALLSAYYSYYYSFRDLAKMFGVSRMTVWRVVNEEGAIA